MEFIKSPPDYTHYIENENQGLPACAIHRHAKADGKGGYHTTKKGEKLVPGITIDFDLSDPFFTEYKPEEYSSIHDPHLKHFLNKKSVRRCLIKNNLITKDGEVKCTLQEFNRFQRNLKHYFKTQKRIATTLDKKFFVDPKKILRTKLKREMLQRRIQHNVKIAEARARHTESNMKRRKQIMNRILQKDRQMAELFSRVRMEREKGQELAMVERKRRELLKIRLDSTELIRRYTILQRTRQKERIVSQKQLLAKQRRIKKINKSNLEWHRDRMNAKEDDMTKFLCEEKDKTARRRVSIGTRTVHAEHNKNVVLERQKSLFNKHQRIEDDHLEEARQWEKKVQDKRVLAANNWRAKMHCMQTIAEGRMADIERRKCERKSKAMARKKAQIEEDLDHLEKMNVTVLGTTGYGSNELANIHRDNSKIRFSAYYDPGRDTIDPSRTTQFHAFFKPLHVIHAKYQPGQGPPTPPPPPPKPVVQKYIHVPKVPERLSTDSIASHSEGLLDDVVMELLSSELEDVIKECQSELAEDSMDHIINGLIDDVVKEDGENVSRYAVDSLLESVFRVVEPIHSRPIVSTKINSNFSMISETPRQSFDSRYTEQSISFYDLIEDVVGKIMACFEGMHDDVYRGQTSTTDCSNMDGEEIISNIIARLVATVQQFTMNAYTNNNTIAESTSTILTSSQSLSRESLKDLHKRAQFLLNHALDVAKVKLKLRGYSFLTWNILEDSLLKARDKIISENVDKVGELTDVELVEWIMHEAKDFLQGATTMLYEMIHIPKEDTEDESMSSQQLVEECYQDQLKKIEFSDQSTVSSCSIDNILEECRLEGDIAKFAILLVKKTLDNAILGIPRRSSIMLAEALRDGNYDLAGSILSAKSISVAHKDLVFDPQTPSSINLRSAMRTGDVEHAGAILANKALQQAMEIHFKTDCPKESSIGALVLKQALELPPRQEDQELLKTTDIIIGDVLREALEQLNASESDRPAMESMTLVEALHAGKLEIAADIMIGDALVSGLQSLEMEHSRASSSIALDRALLEGDLPGASDVLIARALRKAQEEVESAVAREDSSIALENALETGDLPAAGDIIVNRALKSGMSDVYAESLPMTLSCMSLVDKTSEVLGDGVRRDSSIALETALRTGNLPDAGDIIVNRILKSGMSEVDEETAENVLKRMSSDRLAQSDCNVIRRDSSIVLENALKTGDLPAASGVMIGRALRMGRMEVESDVVRRDSSIALENALKTGDLPAAGDIIVNRVLKSGMSNIDMSEVDEEVLRSSSSVILEQSLKTGNLEVAAPILVQRALLNALDDRNLVDNVGRSAEDMCLVEHSSSEMLEEALKAGDLDTAGDVISNRALRKGMRSVTPAKSPSDMILDNSLEIGDLDTAADILANRALHSPYTLPSTSPPITPPNTILSSHSHTSVASVHSFEDLDSVAKCLDVEEVLKEGVLFLETANDTIGRHKSSGSELVQSIFLKLLIRFESICEEDTNCGYRLLGLSENKHNLDEVACILVDLVMTEIRAQLTENVGGYEFSQQDVLCTRLTKLGTKLVFETSLEVLRGAVGNELSRQVSGVMYDYLRSAVEHSPLVTGVDASVSMILGKCLRLVMSPIPEQAPQNSTLSLPEASSGNERLHTEKNVEREGSITEYLSTSDILEEKSKPSIVNNMSAVSIISKSNSGCLRPSGSRKIVNNEGLPLPVPVSSAPSFSKSTGGYEEIRDMLISEEREAMISKIVSYSDHSINYRSCNSSISKCISDTDLTVNSSVERLAQQLAEQVLSDQQIGEEYIEKPSDFSVPMSTPSGLTTSSYIRKIQSKGHVYYIDGEGVVRKRIKKRKLSKKRLCVSQDDFNVCRDKYDQYEDSDFSSDGEPRAVGSESSLLQPSPPNGPPSESSRKSVEHRRSSMSIKKKDSSLQMLAVINSSYTNMLGKKASSSSTATTGSVSCGTEKRPSIEQLLTEQLSETDRELLQKTSNESIEQKRSDPGSSNNNDAKDD